MYDSPISIVYHMEPSESFGKTVNSEIRDQCLRIAYKWGIIIDEKALIAALKQDNSRYSEAYDRGYQAAEEKWRHKLNVLLGNESDENEDEDG